MPKNELKINLYKTKKKRKKNEKKIFQKIDCLSSIKLD